MDTETTQRLARFTPRSWRTPLWSIAADAVREAVALADPESPDDCKNLASALCAFLAARTGWDRCETPDVALLLTESAIEAYVAACGLARGTVYARKRRLNALRVAVAGRPEPLWFPSSGSGARPTKDAARVYEACSDVSFAVLGAVFTAVTSKPLSDARCRGLVAQIRRQGDATVELSVHGTLADAMVRSEYLRTADATATEVVHTSAASESRVKPAATSRRAMRAHDKANRDAYAAALAGPILAPEPDIDQLKPEVKEALEAYSPQNLEPAQWRVLRPLTIRLVTGYVPPSVVVARNVATHVTQYLLWIWNQPRRSGAEPTAHELLDSALVDAYGRTLRPRRASSSIDSTVSSLRRCVRALDAGYVPYAGGYEPVNGPYSPDECELFAWLAQAQPGERMRRNACFLIGLTLGAGLDSTDLRTLHLADIEDRVDADGTHYLVVVVRRADRAREVPVRATYEQLVREALSLSADESRAALVLGRSQDRHNVTWTTTRQLVTATPGQVVALNVARLRTTWLFACMNAEVPLAALLSLSGLRSARTLTDLLPLCPSPDPARVAALARNVPDTALPESAAGA